MNEEVNQVPIHPGDSEVVESWLRETDEPGVRNVNAIRIESPDDITGWQVAVWTMEYVRSDPLETELRSRISDALRVVSGVTSAAE